MTIFLNEEEMIELTGFKRHNKQIHALRIMGIPCRINARGRPIVVRAAIVGSVESTKQKTNGGSTWRSNKATPK